MKVQEAINHFGSKAKIAKELTKNGYPCVRSTVSTWKDSIPPLRQFQIEKITNGTLKASKPNGEIK